MRCADLPSPPYETGRAKKLLGIASQFQAAFKYEKSGMGYNHYDADVNTKQTGYHAKAETKAKG